VISGAMLAIVVAAAAWVIVTIFRSSP